MNKIAVSRLKRLSSLVLFLPFFSTTLFAATLDETFEQLKDSREHYEVIGTICEQVARLELKEKYSPDSYTIDTGIAYSDPKRVLGELDVVVFRNSDNKAILIGEVKCWRNLNSAHNKANEQRARFQNVMLKQIPVDFYDVADHSERYDWNQFAGELPFITISQKGGEPAGFEQSLKFTLSELMDLRHRLMLCQNKGDCPRPIPHR